MIQPALKPSLWEWIRHHAQPENEDEIAFVNAFRMDDEMRPWMKYKDMKRNLKSRGEHVGREHFEMLKTLRKRWKKWKKDNRNENHDSGQ